MERVLDLFKPALSLCFDNWPFRHHTPSFEITIVCRENIALTLAQCRQIRVDAEVVLVGVHFTTFIEISEASLLEEAFLRLRHDGVFFFFLLFHQFKHAIAPMLLVIRA